MSGTGRVVQQLQTVLEAEERLYLRMQKVLQRERETLVELDAEAIEDCVAEKEVLADEGRLLEESRREVTLELARELGLGAREATLGELIQELGGDGGGLEKMHSRLTALVGSVRELIEENDRCAGRSLERVRSTLRLLGRSIPESPTYGPTGGAAADWQGAGRIVRQAV